ncbi:MAG: response regulator transcription factor, partial [Planctomycetales bacterium]|nr:response regulator transcription factor [Planctomycetales bacterium]
MASDPAHVLLAEGNPDLAYMAAHILGRRGWRVTRAATADEARDRVARAVPDLIVLDGALTQAGKGTAGLDLCREIREAHARESLPILFLVAGDREDDVIAGYQAGANDCLLKPFKPAELVAKAAVLIEERRRAAGRARTREIVHRALAGDPFLPEDSGAPFASGFRLRGVLGRGSMGAVFRAVDE